MSRRRMMMQLLGKNTVDLLDGYRIDNLSNSYKFQVWWLDNNTVELKHTSSGFMGPSSAAKNFIGTTAKASTDYGGALENVALPTIELGKTYRLTLTVIDIIKNTATTENDGELGVAMGIGGGYTEYFAATAVASFSTLQIGDRFELVKTYKVVNYPICSACFWVSNPNLLWDITFKVEFEEV